MLLSGRIFVGNVLKEPTTVEVVVDAPEQVILHEPFVVTLQLTNIITATQTVHSLDFSREYLRSVRLSSSAPAYRAVHPLPFTQFTSYTYDLTLPVDIINRPTVIELSFVGQTVGEFSGVMDICLEDGTLCLAVPLQTAVVAE